MTYKNIDELYAAYSAGIYDKRGFETEFFERIIKNPGIVGVFKKPKSEGGDMLCRLYPSISRAIDNYDDAKGGFSAYISSVIRYAGKEERINYFRRRETENSFFSEYAAETCLFKDDAAFFEDIPHPCKEKTPPAKTGTERRLTKRQSSKSKTKEAKETKEAPELKKRLPGKRQLLMMVLKFYYLADEDFTGRAADFLGMGRGELEEALEKIKFLRFEKDELVKKSRCRYYRQYYRCKMLENRIYETEKGSPEHLKLLRELEEVKKRFEKYREKFRSLRRTASNGEIAKVLNLSKGSVDSSLFLAKKKIKKLLPESGGNGERG